MSEFQHGDMVMICGAGPKFDCPSIMVEQVLWAQKMGDDGQAVSSPGWWYLWNRFYPYPVHEQFVFPLGSDHAVKWEDCVWSPSKEVA